MLPQKQPAGDCSSRASRPDSSLLSFVCTQAAAERAIRKLLGLENGADVAHALALLKGAGMGGKLTEATLRRVSKLDESDDEAAADSEQ